MNSLIRLFPHPSWVIAATCNPNKVGILSCQTNLPKIQADTPHLQAILQLLFAVISLVTVIYLIVSAIRYQVSLGDPQATAKLRNTIIYAAVGLAVALSAELIVSLTLNKV